MTKIDPALPSTKENPIGTATEEAFLPDDGDVFITVGDDESGARLDKFLAGKLPVISRTRLKTLIISGQVSTDGVPLTDPSRADQSPSTFYMKTLIFW
jgi:23S rRNA-/tRNA-specific pseudouridylate synthase